MSHMLAELLRHAAPTAIVYVLLQTLLGGAAGTWILLRRPKSRLRSAGVAAMFGCNVSITSLLAFITAFTFWYPQLNFDPSAAWAAPALIVSLLTAVIAGLIQRLGRRSARNVLLAGSILSCGFSCMLFTVMAGLVAPFALAYELTAVVFIVVVGAAFCAFALWELGNPAHQRPWLISASLLAVAIALLAFGSLAAILPLDGWIDALSQPDGLASAPVAVIVAAEAVVVLVLSLFGSLVDNRVAARDRLEAERFRQLADSSLEGILIHRGGEILDANESLSTLIGLRLSELRNSDIFRLIPHDSNHSLWSGEREQSLAETTILAADGSVLPVEVLSRQISYAGSPAVVTAVRDVRQRHASEQRIHFLAHHDTLTELPNRLLLGETLEHALQMAKRTGCALAVLCLDLDGFKSVNDTLGHAAGDKLLCEIAQRLRDTLRETDFVARTGGDEFVVVQLTGAQPDQATALARRLVERVAPAISLDDKQVNVGVSIGIAIYPQDGETATTLLKNSDVALYRAKEGGRGWFCLFEPGMDEALQERREMEAALHTALRENHFRLDFQPLFSSKRELVAFEALLRWTHPTRGPISPVDFIPLAEECGIIIQLGEWVMRTACSTAMGWNSDARIAVNLSPVQFFRSNVAAMIRQVLLKTGLPPHRLEVELTEGVLMHATDTVLQTLTELRGLGVRLVLDDFGTGYSSLSYLHRFAFDKLKVDRSFVQRLETDRSSQAIVATIVAMSRNLDLEVTAEGVETIEQFDLLCAQGCQEFQGFLLSRPIPQALVGEFIRDGAKTLSEAPKLLETNLSKACQDTIFL